LIDSLGAKRIDHKVLPTPGFVTRKWLEFPVKNRADFLEMIKRYNPSSPERYPADWEQRKPHWQNRTFVLGLTLQSMFWRLRDWVGFEGLCAMFYDNSMLVHEMMEYVADLERALSEVDADYVFFNEDMAYKTASMISPKMVKQFMWPRYRKIVWFLRDKGVSVLIMDCDGHISELIPQYSFSSQFRFSDENKFGWTLASTASHLLKLLLSMTRWNTAKNTARTSV